MLRAWRFDAQWWFGMLRTAVVVVLVVAVADYLVPGVVDRPDVAAIVSLGMAVALMTRAVLLLPVVELGPAGLTTEDRFVPWGDVASFRLTRQGRLQLTLREGRAPMEIRLATRPQRLPELERLVAGYVAADAEDSRTPALPSAAIIA